MSEAKSLQIAIMGREFRVACPEDEQAGLLCQIWHPRPAFWRSDRAIVAGKFEFLPVHGEDGAKSKHYGRSERTCRFQGERNHIVSFLVTNV